MRVIPKIPVGIKTQAVGARIRTGQWKFLEGLRFRIEACHLSAKKFAGINHAVRTDFHPSRVCVARRKRPEGNLIRLGIHFANLVGEYVCKPDVAIFIRFDVVDVTASAIEPRNLSRLGIEARQRDAARPNSSGRIDADSVLRTAVFGSLFSWQIRILLFLDFLRRGITFADPVGTLLGNPNRTV